MKFALLLAALPLVAADHLQDEIARLAKISDGVVGMSAVHIESNHRVAFRGTERFPMASTFKVPIAVQLLSRVDRGEVKLDDMITVESHHLHPGSGTLSSLFSKPGVMLSVRNLLELMLLISDNSAADMVLRLAGGPDAVTAKMRSLGIEGINVNRTTVGLISDWIGATLPPEGQWTPDLFGKLYDAVPQEQCKTANDKFNHNERDTADKTIHRRFHTCIAKTYFHSRRFGDGLFQENGKS